MTDGSEVLAVLNALDRGQPCAVIVRHAARHPIEDIRKSLEIGLTEQGHRDARRFGRSLEGFRRVRVFHSPAVRCQETAEAMMAGLEGNGTVLCGAVAEPALCAPYLMDEACLSDATLLGRGFIRAWFEGRLPEGAILPPPRAADMVLAPIVARLSEPGGEGRLDVHVSHDWEICLLREQLLGIRYEEAGWPPYLDGIVFHGAGAERTVRYRHAALPLPPSTGSSTLA